MKKATVTTLLGYIVLTLMSIYVTKVSLNYYWLVYAEKEPLPASLGMLIAEPIMGTIPYFCYAVFFVLVLRNKLVKGLGIAGAALSLLSSIFSRILWNSDIDYTLILTWFYLITNMLVVLLMLLYFCNLKYKWVSPKVSSIGACLSFIINCSVRLVSICLNSLQHKNYLDSFEDFLSRYIYDIIPLIASMMASVFFFAMAKNILKNGK